MQLATTNNKLDLEGFANLFGESESFSQALFQPKKEPTVVEDGAQVELDAKDDRVVGHIYESYDYDKFIKPSWNRDVNFARAGRLAEDFLDVPVPILITENFEIIDGQHRFEARKTKGLPILYVVIKDFRYEMCGTLNSNNRQWSLQDHIRHGAELYHLTHQAQYEPYDWLRSMMDKYELPITLFLLTVTGKTKQGVTYTKNYETFERKVIMHGSVDIPENKRQDIEERMKFVHEIRTKAQNIPMFYLTTALMLLLHTSVDKNRLSKVLISKFKRDDWRHFGEHGGCILDIQEKYNAGLRNKVDLYAEYKQYAMKYDRGQRTY